MRAVIAALGLMLALAFTAAGASAASKSKPQPFAKSEELLKWINTYRLNPEPKRLPQAVKAMSDFGATKDMDQAGVYIGFTAGVGRRRVAGAEQHRLC